MKTIISILFVAVLAIPCHAQLGPIFQTANTGYIGATCASNVGYLVGPSGRLLTCQSGVLVDVATAGGAVTSVTIAGTANQITVAGTCTGTTTISCTLSIPSGFVLPGTIDGLTITTTTGTFTLVSGKTLTVNKTLTLDGTDGVTLTFPATSATIARTDAGQTFTGIQAFTSSPTMPTAAQADNSTNGATTAYVDTAVSNSLRDSGPITISAAQVNASSVTTIPIIAAKGAGTLIVPVNCFFNAVFGSAAFTGGGTISLQYGSNATTPNRQASAGIVSTFLTSFSSSQYVMVGPYTSIGTSATPTNEGVYFYSSGVFASGTGSSVVVDCKYYVQSGVL